MVDGSCEVPIQQLYTEVVTVPATVAGHTAAERDFLLPTVDLLKPTALDFARTMNMNPDLLRALKDNSHLEGIISDMRHVEGGQRFIIAELEKLLPNLCWYRGGTFKRWKEVCGSGNMNYYTSEELETVVIDRGSNGVLGKPNLALEYVQISKRPNPVFYTIPIGGLRMGIETGAVGLVSEHKYDLSIVKGEKSWKEYLAFCQNHLQTQRVRLEE